MNLIYTIRKHLIIGIFAVILIGCLSHYFIFKFYINHFTDQILYSYKDKIKENIEINGEFNEHSISKLNPPQIEEHPIRSFSPEVIKDTLIYNDLTKSLDSYRQLFFNVYHNDSWHRVNINYPNTESQYTNLFKIIFTSLFILFILIIIFTYSLSIYLKKSIWLPFYKNLKSLQDYDLKAKTVLNLTDLGIKEFDELNYTVRRMVQKIDGDYENFRIFLEDTSHEMQTPLSIMKSKLDLLIQSDCLKHKEEAENIDAISRAVTRLSRINRSLLLLTKINNDQFKNKKQVDIISIINNYLTDFSELIEAKDISFHTQLQPLSIEIDPMLSEILISNLLSNSIRHNIQGGYVTITFLDNVLSIENSCFQHSNSKNLFNRLVYREKSEESSGLGLNIVKSICDKNNLKIEYEYFEEKKFVIRIFFS